MGIEIKIALEKVDEQIIVHRTRSIENLQHKERISKQIDQLRLQLAQAQERIDESEGIVKALMFLKQNSEPVAAPVPESEQPPGQPSKLMKAVKGRR